MDDNRTGKNVVLGWELWRGASLLGEQPIVVLATRFSGNSKTGDETGRYHADRNMIQTWIMRADMSPTDARTCDADVSVCGDCPMRKGGCYVEIGKAPEQVWQTWKRGRYESKLDADEIAHRAIRVGSYGDPAAAPFEALEGLMVGGHTGYTHQWRECDQRWRGKLMASVESESEAREAQAAGWRTFRVKLESESPVGHEIECPASKSDKVKCLQCQLCDGATGKSKLNVCITAHGKNGGKIAERNRR